MRPRPFVTTGAALALTAAGLAGPLGTSAAHASWGAAGPTSCATSRMLCTEVSDTQSIWGNHYVGHDEPSLLFYSKTPGSGNRMQYNLTLPTEPAGPYSQTNSYNFELHPAFWFGMAMCDTQSYPESVSKCAPDSDANAAGGNGAAKHPGTAFMELQFYPPGYVKQFAGFSCDATQWCAALNIDSLSEDPLNGTALNPTCQSQILGGIEYVNFAYLTPTGKPLGPPNPLQFNPATSGNPDGAFFMKSGDQIQVSLHDTAHGLSTVLNDLTSHTSGSMTASAANGFGQIRYAPGSHSYACHELPYDFHPEYSTSSPLTTVPWAAHTYNIAFSDEIGHFDFCTSVDPNSPTASCNGSEGPDSALRPTDGDDNFCFSSAQTTLYPATGCEDSNDPGFDGSSYLSSAWPHGTTNTPTPVTFSSPLTGNAFTTPYDTAAFETDLPRIEAADLGGSCNRTTGKGCTNPPPTDTGGTAFYPWFSQQGPTGACDWQLGGAIPGNTSSFTSSNGTLADNAEFGPLFPQTYLLFDGHGKTVQRIDTNQNVLPSTPC